MLGIYCEVYIIIYARVNWRTLAIPNYRMCARELLYFDTRQLSAGIYFCSLLLLEQTEIYVFFGAFGIYSA